jgi:hypothetical protein
MEQTREYFLIHRKKTRITDRLNRDKRDRRYRDHVQPGEMVHVSRPSYTRRDGVKGIAKIVGQFKGPYPVIAVDNHNGVDVDVEGNTHHFNISQVAKGPV